MLFSLVSKFVLHYRQNDLPVKTPLGELLGGPQVRQTKARAT
jgi:hypothetical protein